MTDTVPLTSQEIDDGWCLDAALPTLPAHDDEPYLEFVIEEEPPSSGFEEAFWEQHEGRTLKRRFGDVPAHFGRGPMARGTRPPPDASGN